MFKKLLITLSVLLMAGAAFAGDADWSFYGVAHASLNMLNNGNDSQLGLSSNTSRFGFKGTAPMNEEFTAFWQFESLLDVAGNGDGTVIGTRNTFVGMKHETAGKLVFGRHDTPFKTLGRKVEVFPDQIGDFRATTMGWDNRLGEIIAYVSPDWDGFSIFAAYQFDQGDIMDKADDNYEALTAMSAMAAYQTEQFMIGAAYEAASSGYGDTDEDGNYSDGPKAFRLAAKYFGEKFDIGAMYQSATNQYYDGTGFADDTYTDMGVGACFKVSPKWNVKGQYYMANIWTDAEDDAETTDIDEGDWKAGQLTFGVERVFTENVLCYLQYSMISNGEGNVDGSDFYDDYTLHVGGGQSGFGDSTSGSYDNSGKWQDPSGFSVGTVITW